MSLKRGRFSAQPAKRGFARVGGGRIRNSTLRRRQPAEYHFRYFEVVAGSVEPRDISGGNRRSSSTKTGWTLTGGVEYAFTPNWTVKAEYRKLMLVHLSAPCWSGLSGVGRCGQRRHIEWPDERTGRRCRSGCQSRGRNHPRRRAETASAQLAPPDAASLLGR